MYISEDHWGHFPTPFPPVRKRHQATLIYGLHLPDNIHPEDNWDIAVLRHRTDLPGRWCENFHAYIWGFAALEPGVWTRMDMDVWLFAERQELK